MPHRRPEDLPVDPDLLVLDEGEVGSLLDPHDESEPVESYVPPYVPDPPPDLPASARVRSHSTRAPRWFRVLITTTICLIVLAVVSILHRQGFLESWFEALVGHDEPASGDLLGGGPATGTTTGGDAVSTSPDPTPGDPGTVETPPPEDVRPTPPADPVLPEPPDRRLPDPGPKPEDRTPKPLVVETANKTQVTLLAGEILVELRNGNYLKGRIHTLTDRVLRLAVEGGRVDVELSRLRTPGGAGDPPVRSIDSYPKARAMLRTGEVLTGRLLRSTETEVEIVFPSGRIVLRRDMVLYVQVR